MSTSQNLKESIHSLEEAKNTTSSKYVKALIDESIKLQRYALQSLQRSKEFYRKTEEVSVMS